MLAKWIDRFKAERIPTSSDFSLERVLSEEVQIREWQENDLPADKLST